MAQQLDSSRQHTLVEPATCTGVGLHSGVAVSVRLCPAPVGAGRYFVRTDLPGQPQIPAAIAHVDQTLLSTELAANGGQVRTVEHLLAALASLGVDNVRIEIDGPEVPLLDGSALLWVEAIAAVGLRPQEEGRSRSIVESPVWVRAGDQFVAALPSDELRFSYGIDFDLPAIGNQWHSWSPTEAGSFAEHIAPARTFGLLHQLEALRSQGLIRGGSLDNALVCGPDGWVNPPLRFANEPVRHKLLDLIGDLSLAVSPQAHYPQAHYPQAHYPQAHYIAYKASHNLHTQLARELAGQIKPLS
jgi:UDP-3-O-[3-hydroxymyristoyl] N-acetylglucosamine deacetylase